MTETIALHTLASLALMWVGFAFFYRDLALDRFRQEMFAVRDSLFQAAAEGSLSFDHKAYGTIRFTINGWIRFAHRVSLFHFLWSLWHRNDMNGLPSYRNRIHESLQGLPEDQARQYRKFIWMMNKVAVKNLLLSSPFLMASLVFPIAMYFFARQIAERAVQVVQGPLDQVDEIAYTAGHG